MRIILLLTLFTMIIGHVQAASREDVRAANKQLMEQLRAGHVRYNLKCYVNKRDPQLIMGENFGINEDRNHAVQEFEYRGHSYEFKLGFNPYGHFKLWVLKNGLEVGSKRITFHPMNYYRDMLGLKGLAVRLNLPFLKNLKCFYGRENYFADIIPNTTFSMHYSSLYFKSNKSLSESYNKFLNNEKWTDQAIVAVNIPIGLGSTDLRDFRVMPNDGYYLNSFNKFLDYSHVVPNQEKAISKFATFGHMHFNLEHDRILMMGAFLNYCITNAFYSIGSALITSDRDEFTVVLASNFVRSQLTGVADSLDLPNELVGNIFEKRYQGLSYDKFNQALKKYLEGLLENEIEVVFDQKQPVDDKPILRIIYL